MYRDHTVGVVVPAYNEERFVGATVSELPDFVDRIYLVDDASTDDTWAEMNRASPRASIVEASGRTDGSGGASDALDRGALDGRASEVRTHGNVICIRHDRNRGAGGAVKTGYLAALTDGVEIVATVDGDGQMDPGLLSRILDPIVEGQAGYAKGDRFSRPDILGEMPWFRLFGNVLLTMLTRIATGYWGLSDPQNGFTAVSRDALLEADVGSLWEYYGYMNQLMARLNTAGVHVADVPVPTTYGDEESDIEYLQYIRKVSWLLLASLVVRVRSKYADERLHPVAACYALGTLGGLSGVVREIRRTRGRDGTDRDTARSLRWVSMSLLWVVGMALDAMAEPNGRTGGDER